MFLSIPQIFPKESMPKNAINAIQMYTTRHLLIFYLMKRRDFLTNAHTQSESDMIYNPI